MMQMTTTTMSILLRLRSPKMNLSATEDRAWQRMMLSAVLLAAAVVVVVAVVAWMFVEQTLLSK
jgi:hypothetical protein